MKQEKMQCRKYCGACCIIPSISSALPGLPNGKPAFVACPHLDKNYACKIFDHPERPKVCAQFKSETIICGSNRDEAISNLTFLEK